MVISVEAGLSLDGAIAQVGAKMKGKNPLGDEFTRVITETNLGDSRQDALFGLAHCLPDLALLTRVLPARTGTSRVACCACRRPLRTQPDGGRGRRKRTPSGPA